MTHTINNTINNKIKEYIKNDDLTSLQDYFKVVAKEVSLKEIINKDNETLLHLSIFYKSKNITEALIKEDFSLLYIKNKLGRNALFESIGQNSEFLQFFIDTVKKYHTDSFDSWIYDNMVELDGNQANLLYNTIEYGNSQTYEIIQNNFVSPFKSNENLYYAHLNNITMRDSTLAHIILEKKADYAYELLWDISSVCLKKANFGFGYTPAMIASHFGNQKGLALLHDINPDLWQGLSRFGSSIAAISAYQKNEDLLKFILEKKPEIAFLKAYKKPNLFYQVLHADDKNIASLVFEHYKNNEQLNNFDPHAERGTYDKFLQTCFSIKEHPQVFYAYLDYLKNRPDVVDSYNFGLNKRELIEENVITVDDNLATNSSLTLGQTKALPSYQQNQENSIYQTKDAISLVLEHGRMKDIKALVEAGFKENSLPSAFKGYFNVAANSLEAIEKINFLIDASFEIPTFKNTQRTLKEAMPYSHHYDNDDEGKKSNVLRIQINQNGQIFDTLRDYFLNNLIESKINESAFFSLMEKVKSKHITFTSEDYYLALFSAISEKKTKIIDFCLKEMTKSYNQENSLHLTEKESLQKVHEHMLKSTDFKDSKYLKWNHVAHLNEEELESSKTILSTVYTLFYAGTDTEKIDQFSTLNTGFLEKRNIKNKAFLSLIFKQAQNLLDNDSLISNSHKLLVLCFQKLDASLFKQVFNDNKFQLNLTFDDVYFNEALQQNVMSQMKAVTVEEVKKFFSKINNPVFENKASKAMLNSILFSRSTLANQDDVVLDKLGYYLIDKLPIYDLISLICSKQEDNSYIFDIHQIRNGSLEVSNYHVHEKFFEKIIPTLQQSSDYLTLDFNDLFSSIMRRNRSFLPILHNNIEKIYDKVDLSKIATTFINDSLVEPSLQFLNNHYNTNNEKKVLSEVKKDAHFLISLVSNLNLSQDNSLLSPSLTQTHLIDLALDNNKFYLVEAMLDYLKEKAPNQYLLYCENKYSEWPGYLLNLSIVDAPQENILVLANTYFNLTQKHNLPFDGMYRGQNLLQWFSQDLHGRDIAKEQRVYAKTFSLINMCCNKYPNIIDNFINQPYFLKDFSSLLLHYVKYINLEKNSSNYYGFDKQLGKEMTENVLVFLDTTFTILSKEKFNFVYEKLMSSFKEDGANEGEVSKDSKEKMKALLEKHKMDKAFVLQEQNDEIIPKKKMKI